MRQAKRRARNKRWQTLHISKGANHLQKAINNKTSEIKTK